MGAPAFTGLGTSAPAARHSPRLYTGPLTAERCKQLAEACALAKADKKTLKVVATEQGLSRGSLYRAVQAHGSMRTYSVTLEREGSPTMTVCQVTTPKGALAAAVAAYREYPGTLKNLELPGWKLCVDGASFSLLKVRAASGGRDA